MRKLKIYLDTSVISHLHQPDAPEKMRDTLLFWEELRQGKYHVFIGDTAIREISECGQPKRDKLEIYLTDIAFELIQTTREVELLASKIVEQGILAPKNFDDCLHIAAAVVADCDVIASWNFKHMVNIKTINGVRAVNIMNGFKPIDIYAPATLVERSEDNE